jgi:5-formyltetrahydrofolate cyclo-ligase
MPADDIRETKRALRQEILARRDALPETDREILSRRIIQKILAMESLRRADCIAAYMSMGTELDTRELVHDALASGKRLVLPKVNRAARRLDLYYVSSLERDLAPGVWGIREPAESCELAPLEEVEWVLVPGVAFTQHGERLGYGAGFYDRLIVSFPKRPALIAAAFSIQLVRSLPMSATDQKVDVVVTEDAEYFASARDAGGSIARSALSPLDARG